MGPPTGDHLDERGWCRVRSRPHERGPLEASSGGFSCANHDRRFD